jgi:hypothetical protein
MSSTLTAIVRQVVRQLQCQNSTCQNATSRFFTEMAKRWRSLCGATRASRRHGAKRLAAFSPHEASPQATATDPNGAITKLPLAEIRKFAQNSAEQKS